MRLAIVSIIFIFIFTGLFGFLVFEYHNGNLCPVALVFGGICQPGDNIFSLAIHHIKGLKDLNLAAVGFQLIGFIGFILVLFTVFTKLLRLKFASKFDFIFKKYNISQKKKLIPKNWFLIWFSVLEKRDPAVRVI